MKVPIWTEASLAKSHDRKTFGSGDAELDAYLQRYARQNDENGGAKCFVAAPSDRPLVVWGFYTLSPASLDYARTPAVAAKGLGRYDVRCSGSGVWPSIVPFRAVGSAERSCSGPLPVADGSRRRSAAWRS